FVACRSGHATSNQRSHPSFRSVILFESAESGDSARREYEPSDRLPSSREEPMVAHVEVDIAQTWRDYKESPSIELRNHLVEHFLPLVKYNAERIWARLPDGVDLDDLIS